MSVVGFSSEARSEFLESARYYQSQQPELGSRFVEAVQEAVRRIETHPLLYRIVEGNIRQCRVPRFPYGIIYRVKPDRIEIVAVMHLHRQPGYWKDRMN